MNESLFQHHHYLNASWQTNRDGAKLKTAIDQRLPVQLCETAQQRIMQWDQYAATPLISLPDLAQQWNLAALYCKDEGPRFGLGSFKALGGAYAVAEIAASTTEDLIVACATEGNHGRSVAWGAQRAGALCMIFLHEGVSAAREAAIAQYNAKIIRVPGNYDDAVRECARVSAENNWQIVSDTTWEGYQEIPKLVMAGYSVISTEIKQVLTAAPTHIFLQGGVGGMAAAMIAGLTRNWPEAELKFIIVEPRDAACLLASSQAGGVYTPITGPFNTILAGLACGEPSAAILDVIYLGADLLMAIDDEAIKAAMRLYAAPIATDPAIVSGASGSAGLAALMVALNSSTLRDALDLNANSRVLLINTEKDTDPQAYKEIIAGK
ncbi:MAG: diaminopropionate ammonia-lyase [Burkholderiaceae bacterium]|nr:diaminopropionate ammonia-lyase [Burkholderiaceae bacterium]